MSAETQLNAALTAMAAVTSMVGERIRPLVLLEGDELPGIAYKRESTEYTNTLGNAAVASKVTFDVMCLATDFDAAEALGDAVEAVSLEKLDRRAEYDSETRMFAAVLTIAVWPE